MTLADGTYWQYGYDSLGQVNSAEYKDVTDTVFPGRDFGFTFDNIGNRTQTDTNARTATYTPNNLNEYDQRQMPRAWDVSGYANPAATVTVDGAATTRLGDYFYHELDLSSGGNAAQQTTITATGTLSDGGDNNAPRVADAEKSVYLAPNPELLDYDLDGNLTLDGKWAYTWDAENHLIKMETLALAYNAGAPRLEIEFAYDSQGRRFSKKVSEWDTTAGDYLLTSSSFYIYDGWNLVYELTDLQDGSQAEKAYVWGDDLSGTAQGAGGVGGLLMVTHAQSSTYFPTYDGNGNVMGYYAADTGENVAAFEYGPFGEPLKATGPKKDAFNFRFSTKYLDTETEKYYYGYRQYDAETGRWLSRDPIGENGGLNLYGMLGNNAVNSIDVLGLYITGVGYASSSLSSNGEVINPFTGQPANPRARPYPSYPGYVPDRFNSYIPEGAYEDKGAFDAAGKLPAFVRITLDCCGTEYTEGFYSYSMIEILKAANVFPDDCKIKKISISAHYNNQDRRISSLRNVDRIYVDKITNVTASEFIGSLDPSKFSQGACVDLNVCYGSAPDFSQTDTASLADQLQSHFSDQNVDIAVEASPGTNYNVPGF